jgi:O-antigen/teichoic acid export membrane protein
MIKARQVKSLSLFSNSIWNYAGAATLVIITLVAIPVYLKVLGLERYGMLALLTAILTPITVLNVGVTQATVKFVAMYTADNEYIKARECVGASLVFNVGIGLLGVLFCLFAAHFLHRFNLKISPSMALEAESSLRFVGLQWLFSLIGGNFRGVIEGLRDQRSVFFGDFFNAILTAALCITFAINTQNLTGYLTGQVIASFIMICYWWRQSSRALQGLPFRWGEIRRGMRQVYDFSFWQTVNAAVAVLANIGDKFFIGIFLSAITLGAYNIALRIQSIARTSFYSVNQALFPAASALVGRSGASESVVVGATWNVSLFAGVLLSIIFLCGPSFLELWVGSEVAQMAGMPLRVLILTLIFEIPSATGSSYLNAHAQTRLTAFNNIATTLLTLGLMFLLGLRFGDTGVAMSGLIGLFITRMPFHIWMHSRFFTKYVSRKNFLHAFYGVGFCCIAGALAIGPLFDMIYAWCQGVAGFILAFTICTPLLLLFIITAIRFVLKDRQRMREIYLALEGRQCRFLPSAVERCARKFFMV